MAFEIFFYIISLAFSRSTELKSLMFESKLHVFDIKTVSTPNLENSISVLRKIHSILLKYSISQKVPNYFFF